MSWQPVIGIEIHVQLRTERKLFCGDRTVFGDEPNLHVCPVCLGLPGALPTTNPEAVALSIRTGLALGCTIQGTSVWARKNYFYPDLPKGYQITQFERPIATDGRVEYDGADGLSVVRIRRAHMEEDAGKSVHDRVPGATAVDLNRAGTPLIEIVTEPDLHGPADVRAFLVALRQVLEYADVSDLNMEEGSLRVDANVSLRPAGTDGLGTKTEIKNVNSFSGVERALEIEIARQQEVLDAGGTIQQQTLLWDDHRGRVRPMRSKEESHDYRYFPDPDLPPLVVTPEEVEAARATLPEAPRARRARFENELGLPAYDADVLTHTRAFADYFEAVAAATGDAGEAAKWVMGPLRALLNDRSAEPGAPLVEAGRLADLIGLVADGTVSDSAAKTLLPVLADRAGDVRAIVEAEGLVQVRDDGQLGTWVDEAVSAHPDEAQRYRDGEAKLIGFFVGRVMQASRGQADPRRVRELLAERLDC